MKTQETKDTLEQMIDQHGISDVIEMIEEICYEKEEHVRSVWDDPFLAKDWHNSGSIIARIVPKLNAFHF